jgi:hypothetical protein
MKSRKAFVFRFIVHRSYFIISLHVRSLMVRCGFGRRRAGGESRAKCGARVTGTRVAVYEEVLNFCCMRLGGRPENVGGFKEEERSQSFHV